MKPPSFFGWYEILRTRHHLSVLQTIRYALWLVRSPKSQQVRGEDCRLERKSESRGSTFPRELHSDSFRFGWARSNHLRPTETHDNVAKP